MKNCYAVLAAAVSAFTLTAAEFEGREYDFTRRRLFPGFDGKFCKVQPSVATDWRGTALLTYQKLLLTGSDVFSGLYIARSDDGGETWSEPRRVAVCDDSWEGKLRLARYGNVKYSRVNDRWYAIGAQQTYENDKVPAEGFVNGRPALLPLYFVVDAEKGDYTEARELPFPLPTKGTLPFGDPVELENGEILVPIYYKDPSAVKKEGAFSIGSRIVVVRYRFNGDALEAVAAGTPIDCPELKRGISEPSLTRFRGRFYLTVRSDERGMYAESDDGLSFGKLRTWCWEDGTPIGNRNTQQHWLNLKDRLYLAYTREDPMNGHVFRNRAPIYVAKFDPERGCLVKATEYTLIPELGTRSGNFTTIDSGDGESWLVTAEWMQGVNGELGRCERYGADNSIWFARLRGDGRVGGRKNLLMSGDAPPAAVVEMLPKVAAALGRELSVTVEQTGAGTDGGAVASAFDWAAATKERILPERPAKGRWDFVSMRCGFGDFERMRGAGAKFCLRYANALPKAEIVVVEPLDWKQHRGARDFAAMKSLRVAPVGTAARLLGRTPEADTAEYAYLESLVWVAKLFGVGVAGCPYAPSSLSTEAAARIRRAAQDAVDGVAVPPERGGETIPADVADGMARLRAFGTPQCRVQEVEYSPATGVRVFLLLKPSEVSRIRCEVRLPDPGKWDGRFWGTGCGGWPEMRTDYLLGPSSSAEMKCDMGTLRFPLGKAPVHPEVRRDFGWRATHLSTVAAKNVVKLFYGREPAHSYFFGSSTGGRQAMAEARRFPDDYDGIVAGVPALDPASHAVPSWRIAQLRRKYGTWLTPAQTNAVCAAERAYFARIDPEIAQNRFINDPRPTKDKLDGCWREALRRDPSLAGLEPMWRELFAPVYACGRRLSPGFVIGTEFVGYYESEFMLDSIIGRKPIADVGEGELVRLQDDSDYSMRDADLTAFAARGGKLVTFAGLEDESVPPLPVMEHYRRAVGILGEETVKEFFVHYLIPGRKHAPGTWGRHGAVGDPENIRGMIQDWVEKGVRPGILNVPFLEEKGKAIRIAPYPSVGVVASDATAVEIERDK